MTWLRDVLSCVVIETTTIDREHEHVSKMWSYSVPENVPEKWLRHAVLLPGILFMGVLGQAQQPQLGPLDGASLPATDLERVHVGTLAPDFRLTDETGGVHQLSHHRGKNVVLVIYRGHW